jgi:hypothetical protein
LSKYLRHVYKRVFHLFSSHEFSPWMKQVQAVLEAELPLSVFEVFDRLITTTGVSDVNEGSYYWRSWFHRVQCRPPALGKGQSSRHCGQPRSPGSEKNLNWLSTFGDFELARVDIRDAASVLETIRKHNDANLVLHFAAQVAGTTSGQDPRADFEVNALGTFNGLEAMRVCGMEKTPILYSSTNKVYGGMEEVGVSLHGSRYGYTDLPRGVSEEFPLDFHSPYGCSKGSADQYIREYHRI